MWGWRAQSRLWGIGVLDRVWMGTQRIQVYRPHYSLSCKDCRGISGEEVKICTSEKELQGQAGRVEGGGLGGAPDQVLSYPIDLGRSQGRSKWIRRK